MITIEVIVSEAEVSVPFHLIIDTINTPNYAFIIKNKPFKLDFDLQNGRHSIYISGKNSWEAKTKIIVYKNNKIMDTADFEEGSPIYYTYILTIKK